MLYPVKCACGFCGDVVAKASEVDDNGCLACPGCGQRAPQDYAAKTFGMIARESPSLDGITKQTSMVHQFHPKDAPGIAELMGPEAKYIQTDGTVRFKTRAESRQFNQKWKSLLERAEAKKAQKSENVSKTPKQPKRARSVA